MPLRELRDISLKHIHNHLLKTQGNREYLIRRAALGDNPTQEEMDAVRDYGLEQHRLNFPHLHT